MNPETTRFVWRRLLAMLERPDAWGPPEAVELQVLLLLEILLVSAGLPPAYADQVVVRYRRFRDAEGVGSPLSLAARLGLRHRANAEFTRLLRKFAESELGGVRQGVVPFAPRRDASGPRHYEAA